MLKMSTDIRGVTVRSRPELIGIDVIARLPHSADVWENDVRCVKLVDSIMHLTEGKTIQLELNFHLQTVTAIQIQRFTASTYQNNKHPTYSS